MNPFRSLRDYEAFIYTLPQRFPFITSSTLAVFHDGAQIAQATGEVFFRDDCRLVVRERSNLDSGSVVIVRYSYEVWREADKLYWYDSQPHPGDVALASTDPHHKHIPPDIKHNRSPAPGLSFTQPNLPFLIEEIERELLRA